MVKSTLFEFSLVKTDGTNRKKKQKKIHDDMLSCCATKNCMNEPRFIFLVDYSAESNDQKNSTNAHKLALEQSNQLGIVK